MSINLEKLLNIFEKEDFILNTIDKMTPREKEIISLIFGLIVNYVDDAKSSEKRKNTLISEISSLIAMSDEEWEAKKWQQK